MVRALLIILAFTANFVSADNLKLVDKYSEAIFTVNTFNVDSNAKVSHGTGFLLDSEGYIITNYHVISKLIDKKERNSHILKYKRTSDDSEGLLQIVNFDIVNDLALLKTKEKITAKSYFEFGDNFIFQGENLFSFGNPLSVGTIVVNGTYNGYLEHSLNKKINFTGPINPGMSGGPVINSNEKLVGVNVETSGNGVGYLVNIEHAKKLYDLRLSEMKSIEKTVDDSLNIWTDKLMSLAKKNMKFSTVNNISILKIENEGFTCSSSSTEDLSSFSGLKTLYASCGPIGKIFISGEIRLKGIKVVHSQFTQKKYEKSLVGKIENLSNAYFKNESYKARKCDTEYYKKNKKVFILNTCIEEIEEIPSLTKRYNFSIGIINKKNNGDTYLNSLETSGLSKEQNIELTNALLKELI